MFQQMLAKMLRSLPGIGPVDMAQSVEEGIKLCGENPPDLLLLDLTLKDGGGLAVGYHLANVKPSAKILILTGEASTFVCPSALHKHIHAVLDKAQAFDDLKDELRFLLPESTDDPLSKLSQREREIFHLVGLGMLSKEIGDRLSISTHTVQAHRKRIAQKLGTRGNELAHVAFREAGGGKLSNSI